MRPQNYPLGVGEWAFARNEMLLDKACDDAHASGSEDVVLEVVDGAGWRRARGEAEAGQGEGVWPLLPGGGREDVHAGDGGRGRGDGVEGGADARGRVRAGAGEAVLDCRAGCVCVCVCVCVCIHTHTYIHTYIHTCVCVCVQVRARRCWNAVMASLLVQAAQLRMLRGGSTKHTGMVGDGREKGG